jgi:hypothetical protein
MKYYLLLVIGGFVLAFAGLAFADWTGFTIVNQEYPNIQASRDDDCPWSLVCDKDYCAVRSPYLTAALGWGGPPAPHPQRGNR